MATLRLLITTRESIQEWFTAARANTGPLRSWLLPPTMSFLLTGVLAALLTVLTVAMVGAQTWTLIFSDEFDGTTLNAPWIALDGPETGAYVGLGVLNAWRPQNVTVGNGILRITSKIENYAGRNYTSGLVHTDPNLITVHVPFRMEIRAKLPPSASGVWPGLWTREHVDWSQFNAGQQSIDEYDLLEVFGLSGPTAVYQTTHHWFDLGGQVQDSPEVQYYSDVGVTLSQGFHVYAFEADNMTGLVNFYIDGVLKGAGQSTNSTRYHDVLMQVALGGVTGDPDPGAFPMNLDVDYVRVYAGTGGANTTPPAAPTALKVQ